MKRSLVKSLHRLLTSNIPARGGNREQVGPVLYVIKEVFQFTGGLRMLMVRSCIRDQIAMVNE